MSSPSPPRSASTKRTQGPDLQCATITDPSPKPAVKRRRPRRLHPPMALVVAAQGALAPGACTLHGRARARALRHYRNSVRPPNFIGVSYCSCPIPHVDDFSARSHQSPRTPKREDFQPWKDIFFQPTNGSMAAQKPDFSRGKKQHILRHARGSFGLRKPLPSTRSSMEQCGSYIFFIPYIPLLVHPLAVVRVCGCTPPPPPEHLCFWGSPGRP